MLKKNKNSFKRKLAGIFCLFLAFLLIFAFFEKAGPAGRGIFLFFKSLFGKSVFFLPFIFVFSFFFLFFAFSEKFEKIFLLGAFFFLFFLSALFEKDGGYFGKFFSFLISKSFGRFFSQALFFILVLIGFSILISPFFSYLRQKKPFERVEKRVFKFFAPRLKVEEIEKKEKKFIPLEIKEIELPKIEFLEYKGPPFDLLESEKGNAFAGDVKENSAIIKRTLENFGIKVEMGQINIGPTVTQYTLKPAEGIKLSKITSLSSNLALALAAHPIRIEAPIPGKSLVGIEVPNKKRLIVRLRKLISDPDFLKSQSRLNFVLGRDVSGKPVFTDLSKMPHLLVGGATGTGKTIFLNSLILSLLYRNSPQILNFILIDPKRVEFPVYNNLPHLLTDVIYDPQRTIRILKWAVNQMERRFEILAKENLRDIASYNELAQREKKDLMPYIVLIIDELADLMAARGKEMEAEIVRLAQLSRAVGIHLVIATQRPSVEVITGLIKANITSRISFQVASQIDSRTVLDMAGAERLLGLGDMLFLSAESPKPKRIQGAFVSEGEVKKIVNFLNSNVEAIEKIPEEELLFLPEKEFEIEKEEEIFEDPLFEEAKAIVIKYQKASASLLQRKLKIGYARAARLLDIMEEKGIVGPSEGAKPRKVYIKKGEW
jgi:S-DNA-T family DNA segregation ATPase FtsK/SpoIIIE